MLGAIDNLAVVWHPVLPPWAIVLLVLILSALAVMEYAKRSVSTGRRMMRLVLVALRLVSIVILAIILAGPTRQTAVAGGNERPRLAVLVDVSGSMHVRDVKEKSREEVAFDRAFQVVDSPAIARLFDTSLDGFDTAITPLDPSKRAGGRPTDTLLLDIVRDQVDKLAGSPAGSAILVISDGRDTSGRPVDPVIESAKASGLRIHTMPLGGATLTDNVWLGAKIDRPTFLLNQPGQLQVSVWSARERDITVAAEADGQVDRVPIHLAAGVMVPVTVPLRTQTPGERRVKISLEGLPAEITPQPQHVFYEVLSKRIKVLILAGEPDWNTKFIAQALRRDERIELVSAAALTAGRVEVIATRSDVSAVPTTPQELALFDVIIVGGTPERIVNLSGLAAMVDYVAAGGHVVLLGAMPSAWSVLDPVIRSSNTSENTTIHLSRDAPALFAGLLPRDAAEPALSRMPTLTIEKVKSLKPAAYSLMETRNGEPAMAVMNVGRGRSVASLTRDLWRWRMQAAPEANMDELYDVLWANLVRWLALGDGFEPGSAITLELESRTVTPGRPLAVEVSARWLPDAGFSPRVSVLNEQGDRVALTVSRGDSDTRWNSTFTPRVEGEYRIELDASPWHEAAIVRRFRAVDEDREKLNTSADSELLRQLAQRTGGLVLDASKIDEVPPQLIDAQPRVETTTQMEPAWNRWEALLLLSVMLGGEWLGRRWMGWP